MNADERRFAYYQAFGLEATLSIDPDELKKRFYEQSRKWHPDRFSRASAEEQQKALDMTSTLNDAFRTLRDPVSRAEYFLQQNGIELSKEAPPELLEEVFELNMALEELRDGDQSARPQLMEAHAKFLKMRDAIDEELQIAGARHDLSRDALVLDEIRALLNRRRYIRNLIKEVENVLPN
jgi:molecular chaperone HscB